MHHANTRGKVSAAIRTLAVPRALIPSAKLSQISEHERGRAAARPEPHYQVSILLDVAQEALLVTSKPLLFLPLLAFLSFLLALAAPSSPAALRRLTMTCSTPDPSLASFSVTSSSAAFCAFFRASSFWASSNLDGGWGTAGSLAGSATAEGRDRFREGPDSWAASPALPPSAPALRAASAASCLARRCARDGGRACRWRGCTPKNLRGLPSKTRRRRAAGRNSSMTFLAYASLSSPDFSNSRTGLCKKETFKSAGLLASCRSSTSSSISL
mmetsp:Transcript_7574/g.24192  ORF Transcript_7574/g.24192 Transcript_7574/m.24192 type:complete len:271 (-) Transcript_7574:874-1686(-)